MHVYPVAHNAQEPSAPLVCTPLPWCCLFSRVRWNARLLSQTWGCETCGRAVSIPTRCTCPRLSID